LPRVRWMAIQPCIDERRPRKAIVEEPSIAVEERPNETESQRDGAEDRDEKAMDGACDSDGRAIPPHHPDVPCLHRQRLAAARPEPDEVRASDEEDPGLQQVAAPAVGGIAEYREVGEGR